ncbi:hypothetical protein DY000_02063043 [Brassica cretica]|uniref:Uncharacterized protein n=1 Tax=Brassica cretica TaxID=69181 RepID=A0ABQ7AQI9_BRACR|nr:hypothetical protein DY000_02063043 [Brassica cretica]
MAVRRGMEDCLVDKSSGRLSGKSSGRLTGKSSGRLPGKSSGRLTGKSSGQTTYGGHSEALSDGVRCGLSLVALVLALCVVKLAIVLFPRSGRLKPRLRGSLAHTVSLKWSVKIADVEDSELW